MSKWQIVCTNESGANLNTKNISKHIISFIDTASHGESSVIRLCIKAKSVPYYSSLLSDFIMQLKSEETTLLEWIDLKLKPED